MRRIVNVSIDTLVEVMKDYLGEEDLPGDAKPVKIMLRPSDRKIGLVIESDQIQPGSPPLEAKFEIRRVYGVGGAA